MKSIFGVAIYAEEMKKLAAYCQTPKAVFDKTTLHQFSKPGSRRVFLLQRILNKFPVSSLCSKHKAEQSRRDACRFAYIALLDLTVNLKSIAFRKLILKGQQS
jgi:hypothetical protein